MGLFKNRQQTKEELDAMRAEMRNLRDLLHRTDAAKVDLATRVGHLDSENERLQQHVGAVEARVGEVATKVGSVEHDVVTVAGSIGPTVATAITTAATGSPTADDVAGLRNEMRRLEALTVTNDVDGSDGPLVDLRNQLEDLAASFQRQQAQIADVALVATDAAERSEQAATKIAGFDAADDWAPLASPDDGESKRQLGQLAERVGALDSRVNQVSLELTNQLTELSSDLDRASAREDTTKLIDRINEQLVDITGGQERLANEQARYAIQFREDLAELADRLRRK